MLVFYFVVGDESNTYYIHDTYRNCMEWLKVHAYTTIIAGRQYRAEGKESVSVFSDN